MFPSDSQGHPTIPNHFHRLQYVLFISPLYWNLPTAPAPCCEAVSRFCCSAVTSATCSSSISLRRRRDWRSMVPCLKPWQKGQSLEKSQEFPICEVCLILVGPVKNERKTLNSHSECFVGLAWYLREILELQCGKFEIPTQLTQ